MEACDWLVFSYPQFTPTHNTATSNITWSNPTHRWQ